MFLGADGVDDRLPGSSCRGAFCSAAVTVVRPPLLSPDRGRASVWVLLLGGDSNTALVYALTIGRGAVDGSSRAARSMM